MNRRIISVYLLAAVVLGGATACDGRRERRGHSGAKKTFERSWPAAGIERLKVAEVDGGVKVEAVDGIDTITLVARVSGKYEAKQGVENEGVFETRLDGGTLRIGREARNRRRIDVPFLFDRDDVRVDYELRVPRSVSLALSTVNGRISTRGESEGETDLTTVNGTIDAETAGTGGLKAETVNGRVRARFLRSFHGAQFRTVNGRVEAILPRAASFRIDLSQLHGDFEAEFPVSIHSNPGSRRVSGEVNGGQHELKITTVNGDVELGRAK